VATGRLPRLERKALASLWEDSLCAEHERDLILARGRPAVESGARTNGEDPVVFSGEMAQEGLSRK